MMRLILVFFGLASFGVGFYAQNMPITTYGFLFGILVAILIVVPDWPVFNKHPVGWR